MNCSDVSFEFIGHHEANLIKHDNIKLCKYGISYVNGNKNSVPYSTVYSIYCYSLFYRLNLFAPTKWHRFNPSKTF